VKRAIALGAVAVIPIGAGVFFLTRPSTDVELRSGYATRSWGGAQAVDPPQTGPPNRFRGNGAIAAIVGGGQPVHLFGVTVCRLADNLGLPKLGLDADGHPARVEISPTSDTRELALYEDEALQEDEELVFEGC